MQVAQYLPDEGEPTDPEEFWPLVSVMLSADERNVLAAAHHDFYVWSVDSGECWYHHELRLSYISDEVPFHLRLGPGDSFLSSYGRSDFALWNLNTFEKPRIFEGHRDYVEDALFTDADRIVSCGAGSDYSFRRWNATTGECLHMVEARAIPQCLIDLRELGVLAAGGGHGIELIRRDTLESVAVYSLPFEEGLVKRRFPMELAGIDALAQCAGTHDLLAGCRDAFVRRIDARTGEVLAKWSGHTDSISDLALLPGGRGFVTSSYDKTVRFWSFDRSECIASHEFGRHVPALSVSSSGRVFVACRDGMVHAIESPELP